MARRATVNPNPRTGFVRNYGGSIVGRASIDPRTGNRVLNRIGGKTAIQRVAGGNE